MKKNQHQRKSVFLQDYFTDYYSKMTGSFSSEDLERNKNWFFGWFSSLHEWVDFTHGNGRKVLEIGCSIGAASLLLAERGFSVTATDISPYAIQRAKKVARHPNLSFKILDVDRSHPTLEKKFDIIIAFEVIEHLDDPTAALRNLKAMLKPGGALICSTPPPYQYVWFDATHVSVYPEWMWRQIFRKAGFTTVRCKQIGFVPFFYRFSKYFHIKLPFGLPTRYINSPLFFYASAD